MFDIIEKLAKDETFDKKYRDHSLAGNYKGSSEYHIELDFFVDI
ncbi:type II toxin-antitoxin system YafQ family toxin [Ignavigranum ruoffiae]|nr:type II toxin-antitoxin system YafQ family toxin [Ignavigranum ruoffiae]